MLLFIDDPTRHTDEYILKFKSEAIEKFKEWKALREKQSGKQVMRFRTDGGGEYTSKKFAEYLKSEGILKEATTPYTPQSNGVVERVNRTMMERVRCILDHAGLSKTYWAIAVSVAVYLKNRTPMRSVVGKTPYEDSHGRKPC
jgi:transposase InsO family protein